MNPTSSNDPLVAALAKLGCSVEAGHTLAVTPAPGVDDESAARDWFEAHCAQGATGWAQFSGVNIWVESGAPQRAPDGLLIAAELHMPAEDGCVSHHLRHDGERWIATEIRRVESEDGWIEQRTFLGTADAPKRLAYEVAWEPGSDGALRPAAFRLISKHSD